MSGHSKWSTIKHEKQAKDAARGQVFTKLANIITIAVKEGGGIGDPADNFKLRLAIEKAKAVNMPKNNIDRAIERATKGNSGIQLEEVVYEGFGPKGVAFLLEAITDNRQRSAAFIKNTFENHHGNMGGMGSVSYLFEKMGEIITDKIKNNNEMLEFVINSGAQDFDEEVDKYIIYTKPNDLHKVKSYLENSQIKVHSSEQIYKPKDWIKITEQNDKEIILKLYHALDDLDDVHKVYTNAEI